MIHGADTSGYPRAVAVEESTPGSGIWLLKVNVAEDGTLPTAAFNDTDTIGATETQLNGGTAQAVERGVTVQADNTNTESVFVGVSGVTLGIGIELTSGESFPIEIDDISKVYAICASGGQSLRWFGS